MRAEVAKRLHEREDPAEHSSVRDAAPAPRPVLPTLREREDRYIRRVFKLMGCSTTKTAKVLGIGRATLYRRLYAMRVLERKTLEERRVEARRAAERRRYQRPIRTL